MADSSRRRFLGCAAAAMAGLALTPTRSLGSPKQARQRAGAEAPSGSGSRVAYLFNETGQFIFERCDGKHTVAEIAAELAEQYEVTPRQANLQVQNYLAKLRRAGLVK